MREMHDVCNEIAYLAQTYLELGRWGFVETARLVELNDQTHPAIIYDSPYCKVSISFVEWTPAHQTNEYAARVYYGRSHAPYDKSTMICNGKESYCWHLAREVLHFLDGRTPEYAASNLHSHELIKKFREAVSSKSLLYKLPEWEIRKHAMLWEHYAPRLFEVFDLRHPDVWEQYRQFLKQVYDIKGRNPAINPPLDSIC